MENNNNLILKYNTDNPSLLIKEINNIFKNVGKPVFIATLGKKGELICEATMPDEVNNEDIILEKKFTLFLKDSTDFCLK